MPVSIGEFEVVAPEARPQEGQSAAASPPAPGPMASERAMLAALRLRRARLLRVRP